MPVNPDQNPLFRRVILPWYDTDIACILTGVCMLFVLAFSVIGISVARETAETMAYRWVPWTLLILSTLVLVVTVLRLIQRHTHRFKRELP